MVRDIFPGQYSKGKGQDGRGKKQGSYGTAGKTAGKAGERNTGRKPQKRQGKEPDGLNGPEVRASGGPFPTKERDRKGSVYWQCICDCGKEAKVTENGLVHGNNRSCGCLKRENQKRVVDQLHMVDGTCLEWLEKRKSRSDNTSGFRGIYCLKNGRYRVGIGFKRERYYLGTYDSMEEAVKVRLEAEKNIHGEFVKQYRRWKERADADAAWGKAHPLTFRVQKGAGGTYRVVTEMGEEGAEVE